MKKNYRIIIAFVCLCLLTSCSKDEKLTPEQKMLDELTFEGSSGSNFNPTGKLDVYEDYYGLFDKYGVWDILGEDNYKLDSTIVNLKEARVQGWYIKYQLKFKGTQALLYGDSIKQVKNYDILKKEFSIRFKGGKYEFPEDFFGRKHYLNITENLFDATFYKQIPLENYVLKYEQTKSSYKMSDEKIPIPEKVYNYEISNDYIYLFSDNEKIAGPVDFAKMEITLNRVYPEEGVLGNFDLE